MCSLGVNTKVASGMLVTDARPYAFSGVFTRFASSANTKVASGMLVTDARPYAFPGVFTRFASSASK